MKADRKEATATELHTVDLPLELGVTPLSVNVSRAELEIENSRLQRLVAELLVKNQKLRDELESASRGEMGHPRAALDSAQAPPMYRRYGRIVAGMS